MKPIVLIIYACISVGGLTCFKLGSQQAMSLEISKTAMSIEMSWLSLLGMGLYICSFLMYLGLVARNQLGYIMPITTALVQVMIFAASIVIFKETYTGTQILGLVLVIFGVLCMNIVKQ